MRLLILALLFSAQSYAQLLTTLHTSAEFEDLVTTAEVPVMVSFSASWCGACETLRVTLASVALKYKKDKVIIAYVDADKNSDLREYLLGVYPTVRTFLHGALLENKFTGSKSYWAVRGFVDSLISRPRKVTKHPDYCPIPHTIER